MAKTSQPAPAPIGRPTLFTQELADRICDAIATNAKSLDWVCENDPTLPSARTIWRWQAANEAFCQEVTRAGARRADILFDEILEIADESSGDTKLVGEEGAEVCNHEWISRSKLRIESRFKMAAMLNRKKYGDKTEVEHSGKVGLEHWVLDAMGQAKEPAGEGS